MCFLDVLYLKFHKKCLLARKWQQTHVVVHIQWLSTFNTTYIQNEKNTLLILDQLLMNRQLMHLIG